MPEQVEALLSVIADERPSRLNAGLASVAAFPQGDLALLLRRLQRVQDQADAPPSPEIEDLPRAGEYRYTLFPREQVTEPISHPVFDRACGNSAPSQVRGYALDHTTQPTLLVLLNCGGRDWLYIWYPAGAAAPTPLNLPRNRSQRFPRTSASFAEDLGILTLADRPPDRSDCGVTNRYGWVDGIGFVLLTTQAMPRCAGIQPESWPVTFVEDGWGPG